MRAAVDVSEVERLSGWTASELDDLITESKVPGIYYFAIIYKNTLFTENLFGLIDILTCLMVKQINKM